MKLNEKNLDNWLQGNLKDANRLPEDSMLQTILIQNKADGRRRRLVFWINIILIAAWLTFYVNYRFGHNPKAQISQSESETETTSSGNTLKNIISETDPKSVASSVDKDAVTQNRTENPKLSYTHKSQQQTTITNTTYTPYSPPSSTDNIKTSEYTPPFDRLPELLKRLIPSLYQPQSPDDLTQFVPFKIASLTGLALVPNSNNDSNKTSKFSLKKIAKTLFNPTLGYGIGIGYAHSNSKITKSEFDPTLTNRNYQSVLSTGFGNNQGLQLDAGLRLGYANMTILGAVLYNHFQQTLNFEIPVKEVPVIDINGEIRGYIKLNDSAQTTVVSRSKFTQNEIAIPLNLAFQKKLPGAMSFELGMGFLPKLRTYSDVELPGTADLLNPKSTKLKANFNMPITIRLGVYKHFNNYSAGFTGMFTPITNSKTELPGQMRLQSRQSFIQFTLFKNL